MATEPAAFGPTHNPVARGHTPGGSLDTLTIAGDTMTNPNRWQPLALAAVPLIVAAAVVALALLAAAWPRTALSLSGAALGATRAGPGVEVWRVQARARHDVFRRWIFLEVAPETVWSRGALGHFQRASAVILRLEVQFDASSAPGSARAPAPPE